MLQLQILFPAVLNGLTQGAVYALEEQTAAATAQSVSAAEPIQRVAVGSALKQLRSLRGRAYRSHRHLGQRVPIGVVSMLRKIGAQRS